MPIVRDKKNRWKGLVLGAFAGLAGAMSYELLDEDDYSFIRGPIRGRSRSWSR